MPWPRARVVRWLAALGVALAFGLRPVGAGASVTFTSGLSVSERYSDNVFFSPTDPRGDLATSVGGGIGLAFEGKDMTFAARYGLGGEYHHVEKDANGATQTIGLDVEMPFLSKQSKRVDVRVREGMTYTTELPAFSAGEGDAAGESNQGIQIPRTTTFRNTAGAAITFGWSRRLETTLSYENVLTRYAGDLQDVTVHSGSLNGSYQYSSRTGFSLEAGVQGQDYQEAGFVTSWQGMAGVGHHVTSDVTVDGGVGGATIMADGPNAPRGTSLVFNVGARQSSATVSKRVAYGRAIGSGAGLIASATISDQLSAGATWSVSRTVTADVDLAWARNESTPAEALTIYTYGGRTGISVVFADWLVGNASYSYLTQRADGPVGPDGSRNVFMLTLTATGPSWRVAK